MAFRMMTVIGTTCALALGGAVQAQTALGNSMGSESSSAATSTSSQMASGAHHTPVARAARHQAARSHARKRAGATSAISGSTGSGDMTPSGNANPINQH